MSTGFVEKLLHPLLQPVKKIPHAAETKGGSQGIN
jgi:hypothetical protein